jgi:hypothetical protein
MRQVRLSIVGFGAVGHWLAKPSNAVRGWKLNVASPSRSSASRPPMASFSAEGFDIPTLLEFADARRPLAAYPGSQRFETALEGLTKTDYGVLAEASSTDPASLSPPLSHLRSAAGRHTPSHPVRRVAPQQRWN